MNEDDEFEDESVVETEFESDSSVDPKQQKRKETRIVREKREAELVWAEIFASKAGRREMWKLLVRGGYGQNAFACGPNGFPQPDATWFAAGRKNYVEDLYAEWQAANYEMVYLMHCENDPRFAKAKYPTRTD